MVCIMWDLLKGKTIRQGYTWAPNEMQRQYSKTDEFFSLWSVYSSLCVNPCVCMVGYNLWNGTEAIHHCTASLAPTGSGLTLIVLMNSRLFTLIVFIQYNCYCGWSSLFSLHVPGSGSRTSWYSSPMITNLPVLATYNNYSTIVNYINIVLLFFVSQWLASQYKYTCMHA